MLVDQNATHLGQNAGRPNLGVDHCSDGHRRLQFARPNLSELTQKYLESGVNVGVTCAEVVREVISA